MDYSWFDKAVIYQIYPLGMLGAPRANELAPASPDEELDKHIGERRLDSLIPYLDHIKRLGADCILFNPLFESDAHGYDTRDMRRIDHRIGTNADFESLCKAAHELGLKVMLDGVFNHVGRGFFAFADVREKKWESKYNGWFNISYEGNTNYNDGFWYEAWEGCNELVKLNLRNDGVKQYIFDSIAEWVEKYDIDGLRLDVAYCLDRDFLRQLRAFVDSKKDGFALVGEMLGGDYRQIMGPDGTYSVTNYECYKGIHSSLNSSNMFEIAYSLNRQFGNEEWCLYKGSHLLSFVDNHDVTRIASILADKEQTKLAYGLIFGMPGVPAVYYGSEWGIQGCKEEGDYALRPEVKEPEWNELTDVIAKLAMIHRESKALIYGSYRQLLVAPKQVIFERAFEDERIIVAINADSNPYHADFNANCGRALELISGRVHDFGGGSDLEPYSLSFFKCES
jgi:glycosidase